MSKFSYEGKMLNFANDQVQIPTTLRL